jgi:hypothetical protein
VRGLKLRPRGRATRRQHIILVILLAVSGVALAILLTTALTRDNPSAGSPGIAPGDTSPGGSKAGAASMPSHAVPAALIHDADAYQAFGWIDHNYAAADSGEQLAFGVTVDGQGRVAIEAFGLLWNRQAGLDVSFAIPEGLLEPLALDPDDLAGAALAHLETAQIPATFTDRTGIDQTTYAGTVTFAVEGAGDINGSASVDRLFSGGDQAWSAEFQAATAEQWRLAQASVSLDCPALGIFQQVVSDWDNDFVELFAGSSLQMQFSGTGGTGLLLTSR